VAKSANPRGDAHPERPCYQPDPCPAWCRDLDRGHPVNEPREDHVHYGERLTLPLRLSEAVEVTVSGWQPFDLAFGQDRTPGAQTFPTSVAPLLPWLAVIDRADRRHLLALARGRRPRRS
jgi:hypothetical protein